MGLFGKSKQEKQLEQQMMEEIKSFAGVSEFPFEDAKVIANLLATYEKGDKNQLNLVIMSAIDTIDKYPTLADNWDELMIKYKKLGLFPKWKVKILE